MKTVSNWDALREFGIDALTGEACSLMYRILCDLTQNGKRIVERCLSVHIQSENWNSGSKEDPHVASIMLTQEMIVPLAVFALLESGCREVWVTDGAAIGVESDDSDEEVERMKRVLQAQFAASPSRPVPRPQPASDERESAMNIALREGDFGTFLLIGPKGREILVQTDFDFPAWPRRSAGAPALAAYGRHDRL